MGMYDTIYVPCPKCGEKEGFQTKGGECLLREYDLDKAPSDALSDVNRHAPCQCQKCGTWFMVDIRVAVTGVVAVDPPGAVNVPNGPI